MSRRPETRLEGEVRQALNAIPQVGLVIGVDLALGPNGELQGMHTTLAGIGLTVPRQTAERIGVKLQRVIEDELFTAETVVWTGETREGARG